jgi:hypothetical protein
LDYRTFLRSDSAKGALWQFTNVGSLSFLEHLKSFILVFPGKLAENFGYTLIALFLFAVVYLILKAYRYKNLILQKDLLFLIILALGYVYYISGFASDRAHYYFVAYPMIILAGIGAFGKFLDRYTWRIKNLLWIILFLPPFVLSALNAYLFYRPETELVLYRYLQQSVFQNKYIYYSDNDLEQIFEKLSLKNEKVSDQFSNLTPNSLLITTEPQKSAHLTAMIDNRLRR